MPPQPEQLTVRPSEPPSSKSKDDTAPPISPVVRSGSFPHKTTSAAASQPFIDIATRSINSVPVELDGTPTSPQTQRARSGSVASIDKNLAQKKAEETPEQREARLRDPAVLTEIPKTPGADELAVAEKRRRDSVGKPEDTKIADGSAA
ncbi:hypothetical protein EJ05DRAFT_502121 [Pseudovirgaria hyperparasitica]|uniref:Uncharacterized protein n=1 Tax=Pseudovirgaria hyperparasitica TaxID=470096 RepID=A0A6A6W3N0_9PEZI|nr:uncharacterized protein EJ05DRAFT_502121 [Pseudovirgaria hyperparasitica]KAF2756624.1 hypothetical protein EJ05DRAFT_502121 [Pseudovirgaria hyperparasitica]